MTVDWKIAIVGSGPAGAAAAWTVAKLAPELAARTVVLEAAHHPREKICAGCVTGRSWGVLDALGMKVNVRTAPVNAVRFQTAVGDIVLPRENVARVVRRSVFDEALMKLVRDKGVAVHEGRRVLKASPGQNCIEIFASNAASEDKTPIKYRAEVVIGADGATSAVRRLVSRNSRAPIRTMMLEIPRPKEIPMQEEDFLTFDFRPVPRGFKGYRWIFPSLAGKDDRWMSVGVCDFEAEKRWELKPLIDEILDEQGLSARGGEWREYPFYPFLMSDALGGPRWLLAGEAAGSDQLLAEGISYALESGALAAQFAIEAFRTGDFSMRRYTHDFHWSRVGKELRTLRNLAYMFYSPMHMRMLKAGLFNEKLCYIGGEILAGTIEPRAKVALKIIAILFSTMFLQLFKG